MSKSTTILPLIATPAAVTTTTTKSGTSSPPAAVHLGEEEQPVLEPKPIHGPKPQPSPKHTTTLVLFPILIFLLGTLAAVVLLITGLRIASIQGDKAFETTALDVLAKIELQIEDFRNMALFGQQALRNGTATRQDFRQVYLNLNASHLDFEQIAYLPRTTGLTRNATEEDSRAYLNEHFPDYFYKGFAASPVRTTGSNLDRDAQLLPYDDSNETKIYYPAHYNEPMEQLFFFTDVDAMRAPRTTLAVTKMIETGRPTMTEPFPLFRTHHSVYLMHPGIGVKGSGCRVGEHLFAVLLGIPTLLRHKSIMELYSQPLSIYLFDVTEDPSFRPTFLGGVDLRTCANENGTDCVFFPIDEQNLEKVRRIENKRVERNFDLASRQWRAIVVADEGAYDSKIFHIVLSSCLVLVASVVLAVCIRRNRRRALSIERLKLQNQEERVALRLEMAQDGVKAERELNDWVAHEVRNPLSAAVGAANFVASVLESESPTQTQQAEARDDIETVLTSLTFIDELLRNMLDTNRISADEIKLNKKQVNVKNDILQPVVAMLYSRSQAFVVALDCPDALGVETDPMRLRQIVMNLGRNATKFTTTGFVRIKAGVVGDNHKSVHISIEDSGSGIPNEKRMQLFKKFQKSLDVQFQGTGVGLFVVKQLCELLGAEIWVDDSFDSGVEGFPGTRFVVDLRSPPTHESNLLAMTEDGQDDTDKKGIETLPERLSPASIVENTSEIPEHLSILFVDDDTMLRKIFLRSVVRYFPSWTVQEAASGEASLALAEKENFDLIFMDNYMASVERQLLGTETVRLMRSKGITARICGLSANDLEKSFLESGADAFRLKPFPCSKDGVLQEIRRIMD